MYDHWVKQYQFLLMKDSPLLQINILRIAKKCPDIAVIAVGYDHVRTSMCAPQGVHHHVAAFLMGHEQQKYPIYIHQQYSHKTVHMGYMGGC